MPISITHLLHVSVKVLQQGSPNATCTHTRRVTRSIIHQMKALLNRKFHISQISHCEELVPIRHIHVSHTNVSHFVKFAHVVKLYVAYMRNLHIDKKHPKSSAFCNRFQYSSHICQVFITWFKQINLLKGHNEIFFISIHVFHKL